MALQKKNSSSSRVILISVIIAVVVGVGYVLFQQFYLQGGSETNTNSTFDRTNKVITTFGESILQDPRYQALIEYGKAIESPSGTNPNPFQ